MEDTREKNTQALIEVIESGPLKISGNFILKDLKRDTETSPGVIWICRCGKSSTMPFCDETHKMK